MSTIDSLIEAEYRKAIEADPGITPDETIQRRAQGLSLGGGGGKGLSSMELVDLADLDTVAEPVEMRPRDRIDDLVDQAFEKVYTGSMRKTASFGKQGLIDTVGVTAGGAAIQGAAAIDAGMDTAQASATALTPIAMRRSGGLSMGGDDQLRSVGLTDLTGETPLDFDAAIADEDRLARARAHQQTLQERMVEWGMNTRKGAAEIGARLPYVPSQGLAGYIEQTAASTPHFVGAIGTATAGGLVGGPVGAVSASMMYLGATEATSQTVQTYEDLVAKGYDEKEAKDRASAAGALYGVGSGILEMVGMSTVLRATGLNRVFSKTVRKAAETISKRVLSKVARIGHAAFVEGGTEVLQGILGQAMLDWASGDWERFQQEWNNLDRMKQEFIVGAMLGGGVSTAGTLVNPATYKSSSDWLDAVESAPVEEENISRKEEGARKTDKGDADRNDIGPLAATSVGGVEERVHPRERDEHNHGAGQEQQSAEQVAPGKEGAETLVGSIPEVGQGEEGQHDNQNADQGVENQRSDTGTRAHGTQPTGPGGVVASEILRPGTGGQVVEGSVVQAFDRKGNPLDDGPKEVVWTSPDGEFAILAGETVGIPVDQLAVVPVDSGDAGIAQTAGSPETPANDPGTAGPGNQGPGSQTQGTGQVTADEPSRAAAAGNGPEVVREAQRPASRRVLTPADEIREVQNKMGRIARLEGLDPEVVAQGTETTPRGRLEKRLSDQASRYGSTIYWARLGAESTITGAAPEDAPNAIIINRDADPKTKKSAVLFHEVTHTLEYNEPALWQQLHDDLADSAPDLYRDAAAFYQGKYKEVTGLDIKPDHLRSEAVAVTAEEVTGLLLRAEKKSLRAARKGQKSSYLLELARRDPGNFKKLYNALHIALRALGVPGFKGRKAPLEGPDLVKQRAVAALQIRQALQTLEDIRNGKIESPEARRQAAESATKPTSTDSNPIVQPTKTAPPAISTIGDSVKQAPEAQEAASPAARAPETAQGTPDTATPDTAIPGPRRRAKVRRRRPQDFSRKWMERVLADIGYEMGIDDQLNGDTDYHKDDAAQYKTAPDYSFAGKVPTELKEAMGSLPLQVRSFVKTNVPGARGSDYLAEVGVDAMVEQIQYLAGSKETRNAIVAERVDLEGANVARTLEYANMLSSRGPEALIAVYLRDTMPTRKDVRADKGQPRWGSQWDVVENPSKLRDGATFTLNGNEFVVIDDNGFVIALDTESGGQIFDLSGVETLPVDKGSLQRNRGYDTSAIETPSQINTEEARLHEEGLNQGPREKLLGPNEPAPESDDGIPFALRFALNPDLPEGAKTPFDTKEIVEARKRLQSIPHTDRINTPKRRKKRRQILETLYGTGARVKNREAFIVIGPPAAGKSTVVDPMVESVGGLLVDSDEAKKRLPEYQGGIGAMAVHEESSAIADKLMEKAIEHGDNMVLPRVGWRSSSIRDLQTILAGNGYRVHLVLVHLPKELAVQRAIARFQNPDTKRFVDPDYVWNTVGNRPSSVYNELQEGGGFESYSAYSNDVKYGEKPILLGRTDRSPSIGHQTRTPAQPGEPGHTGGRTNEARFRGTPGEVGQPTDEDGLRFALNPDDDRGIFGQRTFKKITGKQQGFGFGSESPLEREDRIARESKPDDVEDQTTFDGAPETLTREQYRERKGLPARGLDIDHSMLSPNGRLSPRLKNAETDRLSETMRRLEEADREYADLVRSGRIIEPGGSILRQDSEARATKRKILQDRIEEYKRLGMGKRGTIKPSFQRAIDEFQTELDSLDDTLFALGDDDKKKVPGIPLTGRQVPIKDAGRRKTYNPVEGRRPTPGVSEDPEFLDTGYTLPVEGRAKKAQRIIQDEIVRLKDVQDEIVRQGGTIDAYEANDAYHTEERSHGIISEELSRIDRQFKKPIRDQITQEKLTRDEVDQYLHARHAGERNAYIAKINPRFRAQGMSGSGMATSEARAIIAEYASLGKLKALERVAQKFDLLNEEKLRIQLESGLISQEEFDSFKIYKAYAPLKGPDGSAVGERQGSAGKGIDTRGRENERSLGRITKPESILATAFGDINRAVMRSERLRVWQSFYKFVQDNPDPKLWKIDHPEIKPSFNEKTGIVEYGVDPRWKEADEVLAGKIDGKPVHITLGDPLLARGLKRLGNREINGFLRMLGRGTRLMGNLRTALDPQFAPKNLARDVQTAYFNADARGVPGVRPLRGIPAKVIPALNGSWKAIRDPEGATGEWVDHYREYVSHGGQAGFWSFQSVEDQAKALDWLLKSEGPGTINRLRRRLILLKVLIEDINKAVESASRLTTYVEHRRAGLSPNEASSRAKNATVNFNRRGEWSASIGSAFMFFNASIQGNFEVVKSIRSNPKQGAKLVAARIASKTMGLGAILYILNFLFAGEDDDGVNEWIKIPDYEKAMNTIVMLPDGNRIKFPQAYGYNVLQGAGSDAMAVMLGHKTPVQAAVSMSANAAGAFSPIGVSGGGENPSIMAVQTIMPDVLTPLIEQATNTNWYGASISPRKPPFGADVPDSQLAYKGTPKWAKEVAELLNAATGGDDVRPGAVDVSPEIIENYLDFLGGGPWRLLKQTMGVVVNSIEGKATPVREVPFLRSFYGTTDPYFARKTFYQNQTDLTNAMGWIKSYEETDRVGEAEKTREMFSTVLSVEDELKRYRKVISEMRMTGEDSDAKTADRLMREANRLVNSTKKGERSETPLLDEHAPPGRRTRRRGP